MLPESGAHLARITAGADTMMATAGGDVLNSKRIAHGCVRIHGHVGRLYMAEAFIYDHVRTPRGRGKADGSLHEVTALELAPPGAEGASRDRNELDTHAGR